MGIRFMLNAGKLAGTGHLSAGAKGVIALVIFALVVNLTACSDDVTEQTSPEVDFFLNDTSGPPEPLHNDLARRQKADVIALPTITVTVWAIGALIVYIGSQTVFQNTIEDFETVLGMAFGERTDWSWAEAQDEPVAQAEHLTESLNRVAYRSEDSEFYSISGNDYLRFLSMVSPSTILNPRKLKDLLDGKVRPLGSVRQGLLCGITGRVGASPAPDDG